MPPAPRKPCRSCGTLTNGAYCEKHLKVKEVEVKVQRIKYDNERGTAASRGYTYRWSKYSLQYRKDNPLCAECERQGILKVNNCVDHIIPVSGPDDPLFWEPTNHQGLCTTHHSEKTAKEDGAFGNVKKERFL